MVYCRYGRLRSLVLDPEQLYICSGATHPFPVIWGLSIQDQLDNHVVYGNRDNCLHFGWRRC
jgi:hypothetical protein